MLDRAFRLSLYDAVEYAMEVLRKALDNHYGSFSVKGIMIETSFCMLKLILLRYFKFPIVTSSSSSEQQ